MENKLFLFISMYPVLVELTIYCYYKLELCLLLRVLKTGNLIMRSAKKKLLILFNNKQ